MRITNIETNYNKHLERWTILVTIEGFGTVSLLDETPESFTPMYFENEYMANKYIEKYKIEHKVYLDKKKYKEEL